MLLPILIIASMAAVSAGDRLSIQINKPINGTPSDSTILVVVHPRGLIRVDRRRTDIRHFVGLVTASNRARGDQTELAVVSCYATPTGEVIEVVRRLRDAGFRDLKMVTAPECR